MANPFLRRATEYVRDDASFLALVSPAPLTTFLTRNKHKDDMFEVPVRIIGAPGSGKTMLATLAEFKMVEAILKDPTIPTNRELASALEAAGFLEDGKPRVAAVRLPMESEYRDFWELPYEPAIKAKLAFWLVQARAMLGLIRNLTANHTRDLDGITFVARASFEAQVEQIGGLTAKGVRTRALAVQKAIYSVAAGLRPPILEELPPDATAPYAPFDAIKQIKIDWEGESITVSPLVMLDDVHALHPDQLDKMFETLSHREMKFGRWMMMRLDALSPSSVLRAPGAQPSHNRSKGRDFVDIHMQGQSDRGSERRQFRSMALDMANRYLPLVQALNSRNATDFARLVPGEPPSLTPSRLKDLSEALYRDQQKLEITEARRSEIEGLVLTYLAASKSYDDGKEVHLAMSRILMHRHAIRLARSTPSLFGDLDPDPKNPVKANAGVADGARLHLHAKYERPFHYGVEELCDASNENAELFLQFAGALVARIETRAIRSQELPLPPSVQESALVEKATAVMDGWSFPYARRVRAMVDAIGVECLEESLQPNAPLGPGANAVAIPEGEMKQLLSSEDDLSLVLKHAIANGAINVQREYPQGGKLWSLIELTGTICLVHGLTFKRGGFLERNLEYLREVSD